MTLTSIKDFHRLSQSEVTRYSYSLLAVGFLPLSFCCPKDDTSRHRLVDGDVAAEGKIDV